MKALKFMLIAALVSTAAIFSACSKSAADSYKKVQELAAKETLSPEEVNEAVDVIVEFQGAVTEEMIDMINSADSKEKVMEGVMSLQQKYPDIDKLAEKLYTVELTKDQEDKLEKATKENREKIEKATKDKGFDK